MGTWSDISLLENKTMKLKYSIMNYGQLVTLQPDV